MNHKLFKTIVTLALVAGASSAVQAAGDVYVGAGFPGATLGYSTPLSSSLGFRAEYAGGLTIKRNGVRDGTNYAGSFKSNRIGAFVDWFPFDSGFRFTSGLTSNDAKATLVGTGGTSSMINGKTVDLTGETFNVNLKYPSVTPFLGLGWGHHGSAAGGLGFFADLGVQFGRFQTSVQTSVVGKYGITQADVDAEAATIRDSVNKMSVLPSAAIGVTYAF